MLISSGLYNKSPKNWPSQVITLSLNKNWLLVVKYHEMISHLPRWIIHALRQLRLLPALLAATTVTLLTVPCFVAPPKQGSGGMSVSKPWNAKHLKLRLFNGKCSSKWCNNYQYFMIVFPTFSCVINTIALYPFVLAIPILLFLGTLKSTPHFGETIFWHCRTSSCAIGVGLGYIGCPIGGGMGWVTGSFGLGFLPWSVGYLFWGEILLE